MEIIRGSLDDISRPASSEQTGNRVSSVSVAHSDRLCPAAPFSLEVLTCDAVDYQDQSSFEETHLKSSSGSLRKGQRDDEAADEELEDPKLQRAIEEMRRLDEMLSANVCKEKEVKSQRRQLQSKLWQELLENMPEGRLECAQEAVNTRLFLALEAFIGPEGEEDVAPVFETQVPDCQRDGDGRHEQHSEKRPDDTIGTFEVDREETEEEQFGGSQCGASKGKQKQRDFVRRNIELVSGGGGGWGGQVLLTQAERARLAELLQEIYDEEEEEDSARGADGEEDMWAVSVLTSQGYTPQPADLEQLIDIDSKIRLFLPVEEFLSVQSSYTNLSASQVLGPEVGLKCNEGLQPGEKVLQDIKERREQERRLQEIQKQLEMLGRDQDPSSESPNLSEEQLLSLLDGCELTELGPGA